MPYTVNGCFDLFRTTKVDLDPTDVSNARRSRDYLQEQIKALAGKDDTFPRLYGGYKPFGSFARSTKVRPLDDVDMLVLLNGANTVMEYHSAYTYKLMVNDRFSPLRRYCDDFGYLNSTKVLFKFRDSLSSVPNYGKADIKKNGVAVVLNLKSYAWSFDIVPSFPVNDNQGGTSYYLIPNGSGLWIKTDPRVDQKNITEANQYHNSYLIPLIRLIKYWNTYRHSPPTLSSYYLETMLINGMRYQTRMANVKTGIPTAFRQLAAQVVLACPDPKGLGPNLDAGVSWDTKNKVREAATKMVQYADWAIEYENKNEHKDAIMWWGFVFPNFPTYGL